MKLAMAQTLQYYTMKTLVSTWRHPKCAGRIVPGFIGFLQQLLCSIDLRSFNCILVLLTILMKKK